MRKIAKFGTQEAGRTTNLDGKEKSIAAMDRSIQASETIVVEIEESPDLGLLQLISLWVLSNMPHARLQGGQSANVVDMLVRRHPIAGPKM